MSFNAVIMSYVEDKYFKNVSSHILYRKTCIGKKSFYDTVVISHTKFLTTRSLLALIRAL